MGMVLQENEKVFYPRLSFDTIVDDLTRAMGIRLSEVDKKTLEVRHKGKCYVAFCPNGLEFRANPSSPVVWAHLPNMARNAAFDTNQRMAGIIVKK